ncbi:hypothetical protein BsWGS_06770 [Bradybaena similaris]
MLFDAITNYNRQPETDVIIRRRLRTNYYNQNRLRSHSNDSGRANYRIPAVDQLVTKFQLTYNSSNSLLKLDPRESYNAFLKRLHLRRKKGVPLVRTINTPVNNSAEKFHRGVNQYYMYNPDENALHDLLQDLSTLPIVSTGLVPEGSQLKMEFTFADGTVARFKPMRQVADRYNRLDSFVMSLFEHHQAEIAGFHLDRLLGFHRAVPTIGRAVNMTEILSTWSSNKSAIQSVYKSHTGNLCVILHCYQYCGLDYPLCGQGDSLPGALSAGLPPWQIYRRDVQIHPYKRAYRINKKASWETDEGYCNNFVKKNVSIYTLLEFIDLAAFDFLAGNLDRHAYQQFIDLGMDTFVIMFDNGRGFSQPTYDHMSILAPIRQCCLIRLSTLAKFIKLYKGPNRLSEIMRLSLNSDPLSPVLMEADLEALDRRVGILLQTVSKCLSQERSWHEVVVDDLNIHSSDQQSVSR